MATGNFENWGGAIAEMGPLYPFVGSEFVLWIIGVVLWLVWHFMQSGIERRELDEAARLYRDKGKLREIVAQEDPRNP